MATKDKCAHPSCTCMATTDSKFCGTFCAGKGDAPDIECTCGHPGCGTADRFGSHAGHCVSAPGVVRKLAVDCERRRRRRSERCGIGRFGATDFDYDGVHGEIEPKWPLPFKSRR